MSAPGTEINVIDRTVVRGRGADRPALVLGPTQKGEVGELYEVESWRDFQRKLGGLMNNTSLFPLLCKRALDKGSRLIVSRAGHYSDPTDASTVEGTKSYLFSKAGSTQTESITGADDTAGTFTVGTDLSSFLTQGIQFDVTGSTGNNGTYTVESVSVSGGSTTITVEGSVPDGTADGNIEYSDQFIEFRGKGIGPGYDAIEVDIASPASGNANVVDITVTVPGFPALTETFEDFSIDPGQDEIGRFNDASRQLTIETVHADITTNSSAETTSGGVYDVSTIVDADYVGDETAETGVYSFNKGSGRGVRISVPHMASPTVDIAVNEYAEKRGIKQFLRGPIGDSAQFTIDYRQGNGTYSHSPIDSYHAEMWTGGMVIKGQDTGQQELQIPTLGDALGKAARRDTEQAPWYNWTGYPNGVSEDALRAVRNFGNPARKALWNDLSNNGINAFIEHESFGPIFMGNRTLHQDPEFLQYSNVADLILEMKRIFKPLLDQGLMDPLDTDLWKELYNEASQELDEIARRRGLQGGEDEGWVWVGDQEADTPDDAQLNETDNLNNGTYIVNLFIKPVLATEFIQLDLTITDTGADLSVVG